MGLWDGLKSVLTTFVSWLPQGGNKQTTDDIGNVSKTSPWLFDYDVFRINWEKVSTLQDIDEMLRKDPRLRRANNVFASTAVRRGLSVKVSTSINESLADQAQEIIDDLLRTVQMNSKLQPWARSLLKDGELFLNPVIDNVSKKIIDIKNLPAITMQRNENIKGRFDDLNDAFRQIDPVSREILQKFPLWSINHIRHGHESGQLYGVSQYRACLATWKKLEMMEQDMVVRRRTRAVPRRLHIVGNKDNPGGWDEVKRYKAENSLDNPKKSAVTTDYFGNGLTDIKDLNGDAMLDKIADVEYFQELLMLGTGVPLAILGFGQNINRDILSDQKKQFDEDVQTLRDLIEYGDESSNSGLRVIFDLALMLQGIDPELISYSVNWAETNDETIDDKVSRVIMLRSAQPTPLMSQETAMSYLGRDIGYENQDSIDVEIEKIKDELAKEYEIQQQEEVAINPETPTKSGMDRTSVRQSLNTAVNTDEINRLLNEFLDSKDDRSKKKNYLHSSEAGELEKELADEIYKFFKVVFKTMRKDGLRQGVEKVIKLKAIHSDNINSFVEYVFDGSAISLMSPHSNCNCSDCVSGPVLDAQADGNGNNTVKLSDLVEAHVIAKFEKAWKEHEEYFVNLLISKYGEIGAKAFEEVSKATGIDASFNFVHSGVKDDLANEAGLRVKGIEETTRKMLAKTLSEAYENGESTDSWLKRIGSVMDIPEWRSEMIARTELSFAFNKANLEGYQAAGITKVKWLIVDDKRTCEYCRNNAAGGDNGDGVYTLSDLPSIPAHPRCRCTTIAVF